MIRKSANGAVSTRLIVLSLLWSVLLLPAAASSEWYYLRDFSAGLNTQSPGTEPVPPFTKIQKFLERNSKSLRQIGGADTIHTHRLGLTAVFPAAGEPVRGLYRYYDQLTGEKYIVAACGEKLYAKDDGDTFKVIGDASGTITVTNGVTLVRGDGSNWHHIIGPGDGNDYKLIVNDTVYDVWRVNSSDNLLLASAWPLTTVSGRSYSLGVPVHDTNYVDFEYWRDKLFIADGAHPVYLWRHDSGLDFKYWIMDSVLVDSVSLVETTTSGRLWPRFYYRLDAHYPTIDSVQAWVNACYCLSFADTAHSFGFHKPLPLFDYSYSVAEPYLQACAADTGLFYDDGSIHNYHVKDSSWAYIVKPLSDAYAFQAETLYTGVFDSRDTVTVKQYGASGKWSYTIDFDDDDVTWTNKEFNTGCHVLVFTDSINYLGEEYPFRTVNIGGDVRIRITTGQTSLRIVIDTLRNDWNKYQIIKLHYYPCANFVVPHNSRMWYWGVNDLPDRLYYGDLLDPYTIKIAGTYNPFYIRLGDKAYATGMETIGNRLYVFKNSLIWTIIGYDEYDWESREVYPDFGALSSWSIFKYFNDIYFTAFSGLYRFNGQNITYLSDQVRRTFEQNVHVSRRNNVVAIPYEEDVWIGFGTSSGLNNDMLQYDFVGYSQHSYFYPYSFAIEDAPGDDGDLLIGTVDGQVLEYGSDTDSLVGSLTLIPTLQTAFTDLGYPEMLKRVDQVEVKYKAGSDALITVLMYSDYLESLPDTIGVLKADAVAGRALIDCEVFGHSFSFLVLASKTADSFEIYELGFNYTNLGKDENAW